MNQQLGQDISKKKLVLHCVYTVLYFVVAPWFYQGTGMRQMYTYYRHTSYRLKGAHGHYGLLMFLIYKGVR